jgi:heptosyltransferase-2
MASGGYRDGTSASIAGLTQGKLYVTKPLIVRLCNWVGEAVLALPGLLALEAEGYELHIVGKRWAVALFAAHGWHVSVRPAKRGEAIAQLKELRLRLSMQDATFASRPNMVLLTNSFSSALEARLAGLKPVGYAKDGRGFMLIKAVRGTSPVAHESDNYWRVCSALLAHSVRPSGQSILRVNDAQVGAARDALGKADVTGDFVVLCPFSGAADTTGKKQWPVFPELARALIARGLSVVLCPGPGEELDAERDYAGCHQLEGLDLGVYAALMRQAKFVVSNDTGPGHIAGAVGANLLAIFGPGSIAAWAPIGLGVRLLHPVGRWADMGEAMAVLNAQWLPA